MFTKVVRLMLFYAVICLVGFFAIKGLMKWAGLESTHISVQLGGAKRDPQPPPVDARSLNIEKLLMLAGKSKRIQIDRNISTHSGFEICPAGDQYDLHVTIRKSLVGAIKSNVKCNGFTWAVEDDAWGIDSEPVATMTIHSLPRERLVTMWPHVLTACEVGDSEILVPYVLNLEVP